MDGLMTRFWYDEDGNKIAVILSIDEYEEILMNNKKALQHMCAWGIQTIYQTYKESMKIREDKELSEEEKTKRLHGSICSPEYQLLNLILLLKPGMDFLKKEFPEQEEFHKWFDDRMKYIEEMNLVNKECNCKGCKIEEEKEKSE
jgi:hypothetical protein